MRQWIWAYGAALAAMLCGISCGGPATDSTTRGQLIIHEAFPSGYIDPRPVRIWLPPGYDGTRPHAVLYMHDGQMLFDSTFTWNGQEWQVDETMTRLLAEQKIRPAIVVGIDYNGSRRAAEYFPQAILDSVSMDAFAPLAARWLGDRPAADAYLQFLTRELKPYVDSAYHTLPGRDHTFIMGSSMGGLISLYALCEYPETFGGAACMSTHWTLYPPQEIPDETYPIPDAFRRYLLRHIPDPANHRIYFDYGTTTLDSLYPPYQALMDTIMRHAGYTTGRWITRAFPGDSHTEQAWAERLHYPLEFLLRPSTAE